MGRRSRRGGLALCAAFVLAVTGVTLQPRQPEPVDSAAATATGSESRGETAPAVIPDRYLVQTDSHGADRTRLLSAIRATGASINHVYEDSWDGVSVNADESQLAEILALPGVQESFPVHALQLEDPPASVGGQPQETGTDEAPGDQRTTTDEDPAPDEDEPVTPAPRANDDSFSVDYRTPTVLDILANDAPDAEQLPVADSVILTDPSTTEEGHVLTVPGQGTFQVRPDGRITFTSDAGFTGPMAAVTYQVRYPDGITETAQIIVTVAVPPAPVAADDAGHTTTPKPAGVDVLGNDNLTGLTTLQPDSLCLVVGDDCAQSRTTPEGEWTVGDGRITFTPEPGFRGAAEATYRATDELERNASATVAVTVHEPPSPSGAHVTTGYLEPVEVNLIADAQSPDGAAIDPESLQLLDDEDQPTDTLAVVGVGAYEVHGESVRFVPAPGFTGEAPAVRYRVSDVHGVTATASLVVTVSPPGPVTAGADTAQTTVGVGVTVHVLGNDDASDPAELDPLSVCLVTAEDCLRTAEIDGHTWVANPDGTITVTPALDFLGVAEATYRVSDEAGQSATATVSVTVYRAPVATDDHAATGYHQSISVNVLENDRAGVDEAGNQGELDPTSVRFTANSTREYSDSSGRYEIDETSGWIRFTPADGYHGETDPVEYEVADSYRNRDTASLTITVGEPPAASDDTGHAPARHAVENLPVLANDAAGEGSAPLDPATLALTGAGTTPDGQSRATDEGVWTVNADHTVTFTPDQDFHGRATSSGYQVADENGAVAEAGITVTIGVLTTMSDMREATSQNVTLSVDPDSATTFGDDGDGQVGTLRSVRFPDSSEVGQRLVIAEGQGLWQITEDNQITFNPETRFVGTTTPVDVEITDSFGNAVSALISIDVVAITPTIAADSATTPANRAVTVPVLTNDRPGTDIHGNPAERLDYAKVGLVVDAATTKPKLETSRGTWTVTTSGVVFTPRPNVVGENKVQYRVLDHNDTPGYGWISVNVGALPRAGDDTWRVDQGLTLSQAALANDLAGDDGSGKAESRSFTSVVFTDPKATDGGKRITNASYTWTVDARGTVKFTPYWRFTGTAATTYKATDRYGNSTTARITITVAPTAPTSTEKRLTTIGALQANADGAGIKVGIIDSGIDYTHPDLGGASTSAFPTSRVTKGRNYVGSGAPMDCYGHGTHVAGIVGADGNPKIGGAYGVAPKVTFGAYKVFDCSGAGTSDNVLKALQQASADGMNVINLSLGESAESWPNSPLSQAAANLVKKGVVVIASVGNSSKGLFTVGSPAVASGVISVAAASADGNRVESYSAIGLAADLSLSPTLTTPGSGVYSTVLKGGHENKVGTSMAAPQVAGAVAELLQAKGWRTTPGTPARVAALLYGSAVQLKSTNSKLTSYADAVFRQGAGLLRVDAALRAAVTASPAVLKLGEGTSETKTITLSNSGSKPIAYKVSAVTGLSAVASTGSRTDVGNQTPYWAYGAVGFKAWPSSVTVPAGKTAKVKVKITAPSRILARKQGMLYGGWVRFTASGQQTVSVPFAGLRGDYQKVKLLPSSYRSFTDSGSKVTYKLKLPGLARRNSAGALETITSGTPTFRAYPDSRLAYVMFHLDYPTSAIRLKAINTRTRKSYYAVLTGSYTTQLSRRGRDEGYTALPFYGIYVKSKNKRAYIPTGTYKLQLRVLKPLGSSGKSSHWETYTTRAFKLVRS